MLIVAFDPGGTTGIAVVNTDRMGSIVTHEFQWEDICRFLDGLQDYDMPDVIVYEKFTITEGTAKLSPTTAPMDVIGTLKYVANRQLIEIVGQKPYDAKHFATDERLKAYGWYTKGKGHANDAARHLMLYCVKHNYVQFDSNGALICPNLA
jgi:hypothetical protein